MNIYRSISLSTLALCLVGLLIGCGADDPVDENQDENQVTQGDGDPDGDAQGDTEPDPDGDAEPDTDGDAEPDPDGDAEPNGDAEPDPDNDADPDPDYEVVPVTDDCADVVEADAQFQLSADRGAYYGRAVLAGEAIWVAYIAGLEIDGDNEEKAFLARYSCDGEPLGVPRQIGTNEPFRNMHMAIAADDETVYTVWVRDDNGSQQLVGRTFDVDGNSLQNQPFVIEAELKTGEVIGTIWKPDLAVTNDGNAVLVVEGLTIVEPRVIMQRFDRNGDLVLNGLLVHDSDIHGGQHDPAVTVMADGTIQYAYLGGELHEGRVYHGTISADGDDAETPPVAAQVQQSVSQSVRFSKNLAGGFTWMAYPLGDQAQNSVVVRDAEVLGPTQVNSTVLPERTSGYIDVAASPTGGALAWMSYTGAPSTGRIHFKKFNTDAEGIFTGSGTTINQHTEDDAAWPYGPEILWLTDEFYVAIWSERDGDFSIHGRILDLQ